MSIYKLSCVLSVSALLFLNLSCNGNGSKKVKGKVQIGQLGTHTGLSSFSASGLTEPTRRWGDFPASDFNYAYANVDGMKVNIKGVYATSGTESHDFASFSEPKEIELSGVDSIVLEDANIEMMPGSYDRVGVKLENKVSIKAVCRTKDYNLYTTASGVQSCPQNMANCKIDSELPSDYDYYTYDFMNPMVFENDVDENNLLKFEIAEGSSPKLVILIDTGYLVSCADLDAQIDLPEDGKLAPFSWSMPEEAPQTILERFGWGLPGYHGAFATEYLPLFTYITSNENEPLPVGETYISSNSSVALNLNPFDHSKTVTTTIAFNQNDEIIAARSRGLSADHGTGLEQGWSGFKRNIVDGTYVMMNGEHWGGEGVAEGDYSKARWLQDRTIPNFKRLTIGGVEQFNIFDGPDCGQDLGDKNQDCLEDGMGPNPISSHWKRIR